VTEKAGMDKEQLVQEVYQRGYELEQRYYGCAQCVVGAIQDFFPLNNAVFKAATSFSGGIASSIEGSCGVLTGGIMVLSYYFGRSREEFADISLLRRPGPLVQEYWDMFREKYGGESCREVQNYFFGTAYHFLDNDEYYEYEERGGHKDKCPAVVGEASAWLAEKLIEHNVPILKQKP